jgi:hypothetical protein
LRVGCAKRLNGILLIEAGGGQSGRMFTMANVSESGREA